MFSFWNRIDLTIVQNRVAKSFLFPILSSLRVAQGVWQIEKPPAKDLPFCFGPKKIHFDKMHFNDPNSYTPFFYPIKYIYFLICWNFSIQYLKTIIKNCWSPKTTENCHIFLNKLHILYEDKRLGTVHFYK